VTNPANQTVSPADLARDLQPDDLLWVKDEHGAYARWDGLFLRAYNDGGWGLAIDTPRTPEVLGHLPPVPGGNLETSKALVCKAADACPQRLSLSTAAVA
jgi:hypothetical protein